MSDDGARARRTGAWVVAASFVLTAVAMPFYVPWANSTHQQPAEPVAAGAVVDESKPHSHDDPTTKNAVSRAHLTSDETADPTTATQALASKSNVDLQRAERDPTLRGVATPKRTATPGDRYAMAGGCYALQSTTTRKWVARSGTGYAATAASASAAEPIHFQATDLGVYLLYGRGKTFVTDLPTLRATKTPSSTTEWTAEESGSALTFARGDHAVTVDAKGALVRGKTPTPFVLRTTTGCETYPELDVNVSGDPHGGTTGYQEVRGYLDAHVHGMAFEFLGGQVHCGRPWHKYGVEYALQDCPDHKVANGNGALLENLLKGGVPVGAHDPVGYPTFKDWPAPDSLTHEGTYYKWLERSWRGGQRILVNLFVENNQLCTVYPLKRNSCDDMDSVRLQAKDIRDLERYIDAQSGGPGKGWYRIVTSPFEARQVINQGKLAVVLGMETSVPFGCSTTVDIPECSTAQIDRQVDEMYDLGVRQMELVNKFDNALAGVAGDTGGIAPLINAANFLESGSFWDMRTCAADAGEGVEDRAQLTAPSVVPEQDALFGAIAQLYVPIKLPLYASAPHCNNRGLTTLGEHTITRMANKGMVFDPDHMSVKARKAALDVTEKLKYSGVVSSHSWSTPDAYPRIYRAGGVITPYAGDSSGFVEKWRKHLTWADPRYYFGFGFGADINGLGAQGNPRGADAPNQVTYPFTGLGGVTIDKQTSGSRVYDINTDGVAHYGLYPDWIEDLRKQGGQAIADDMARGSEAYLQMWERAVGVSNDACRDASALKRDSVVKGVKKGSTVEAVLKTAGQPHTRLGTTFGYCAKTAAGKKTTVTVTFDAAGKVTRTA